MFCCMSSERGWMTLSWYVRYVVHEFSQQRKNVLPAAEDVAMPEREVCILLISNTLK